MPRKSPKKKRYYRRPVNFGPWKPPEIHEHKLAEKTVGRFIIDYCTDTGCNYEAARDLI